jgi:hypothetical protein
MCLIARIQLHIWVLANEYDGFVTFVTFVWHLVKFLNVCVSIPCRRVPNLLSTKAFRVPCLLPVHQRGYLGTALKQKASLASLRQRFFATMANRAWLPITTNALCFFVRKLGASQFWFCVLVTSVLWRFVKGSVALLRICFSRGSSSVHFVARVLVFDALARPAASLCCRAFLCVYVRAFLVHVEFPVLQRLICIFCSGPPEV